jgi:hypothetical protein
MQEIKLLVCGTQTKKDYSKLVSTTLTFFYETLKQLTTEPFELIIIHGGCPDSADVYAEAWAEEQGIISKSFLANKGTYLKRNIEMVKEADCVIAYWDKYSYGTCFTIAHAVLKGIKVDIYDIKEGA